MLCVGAVMDVVFSVCIVRRGCTLSMPSKNIKIFHGSICITAKHVH